MTINPADLANIHAWIRYLDSQRNIAMARLDDIAATLIATHAAVDSAIAEIADLKGKLDAASQEDPRLGAIADRAAAILAKLEAVVPAPAPAPVIEDIAEQSAQ